jgi:hypothetical protein
MRKRVLCLVAIAAHIERRTRQVQPLVSYQKGAILQNPSRASYNEIGFRLISPFGPGPENVRMQAGSLARRPQVRNLQENGRIYRPDSLRVQPINEANDEYH